MRHVLFSATLLLVALTALVALEVPFIASPVRTARAATADEGREGAVRVEVRGVIASPEASVNLVVLSPADAGGPSRNSLLLLVEASEASAIASRMQGEKPELPSSADALGPTIRSLGGKLERVVIESADPLASQGKMFVTQGRRALELSAPAPDSIAVAVESGAPIFAPSALLESMGLSPEELEEIHREAEGGLFGPPLPDDPALPEPGEEPGEPGPDSFGEPGGEIKL